MQRDKTENWGPERESHTPPPVSGLSGGFGRGAAPGRLKRLQAVWPVCPPQKQRNSPSPTEPLGAGNKVVFEALRGQKEKQDKDRGERKRAPESDPAVRSAGLFQKAGFHRAAKWGKKLGGWGSQRVCSGGARLCDKMKPIEKRHHMARKMFVQEQVAGYGRKSTCFMCPLRKLLSEAFKENSGGIPGRDTPGTVVICDLGSLTQYSEGTYSSGIKCSLQSGGFSKGSKASCQQARRGVTECGDTSSEPQLQQNATSFEISRSRRNGNFTKYPLPEVRRKQKGRGHEQASTIFPPNSPGTIQQ